MLEVLQPGLHSTIQDSGRIGYEAYGIPRSGAFDPHVARIANYLVGNADTFPVIEFAVLGPSIQFLQDTWISIASAGAARFFLKKTEVPLFEAVHVRKKQVLQFSTMDGWFGYIAVAGGLLTRSILGSSAAYVAGNIGGRLEKGMKLQAGNKPTSGRRVKMNPDYYPFPQQSIYVMPALHSDLFTNEDRQKLVEGPYSVQPQSNRMGIHLAGPGIASPRIQRSVPALPGTIQIARDEHPIILGPEGPTTGGYPQIGLIAQRSWTTLAATRPGNRIRLEWTTPENARRMLVEQNAIFRSAAPWTKL